MNSYTEKPSRQPPRRLVNGSTNVLDLASLHQTFTQYCLWLETQGIVPGEEHIPFSSPSSPSHHINYPLSSPFSSSENLFGSAFDSEGLGAFTPFSFTALTSVDPTAITAGSDQDEIMLDLMFDDFTADKNDSFPSFLAELQDLDPIHRSSISDGSTERVAESRMCLNERMCCFARASKTLKSLHIPSPACLSTMGRASSSARSPPSAPRTAGSVLTGNREAMLALSNMLRCSCSLKIQLQLVMATIIEKMITWCRAMVHSKQNFGFPSSSADSRPRVDARWAGRERVLCQPITIGDYCLDGAAEAQITGRVLLAHLKAMEFLVVALQRRIKDDALKRQGGDQLSSSPEGEGELLGIIGDGLFAHLVSELQGAREGATRLIGEFHDHVS